MLSDAIPNVRRVIAVGSGKGGVGKSTTTTNLALAVSAQGYRVGILDADIYGPNQPALLGVANRHPDIIDNKLQPVLSYDIQTMSIEYLIDPDQPVVWRGPMISQAVQQLLFDTQWQNLDYLFVDLPPGTGDVQLTLAKKVSLTGAIIVTTPQDIALLDVRKAIAMFKKVSVPVLGVVENMSIHTCEACGHRSAIFGDKDEQQLKENLGLALLGQLPLDRKIREQSDLGRPIVIAQPDSIAAKQYKQLAEHVLALPELVEQKKNKTPFPRIVVE